MKRFSSVVLIVLLLLVLFCSGCQPKTVQQADRSSYEITDIQGSVISMEKKPTRILTLSMETDEIVLGLVEPGRLVAVNALLDDPGESTVVPLARQISQKITDPSVESIAALQPDLIIVPDWGDLEKVAPLRDIGMKVVVCKGSRSIADIKDTIKLISEALGEPQKGAEMVHQMDAKMQDIKDKVDSIPQSERKRVVLLSLMNTYGGIGCVFDDACTYAGVINGLSAAGIHNGQALSKEMLVKINPDYLFLPSYTDHGRYDSQKFVQSYIDDPALQEMKAIKQGHLATPRDSYIYNCSQDIVFGIQEIALAVYGDRFQQPDGCHISVVDMK